MDFDSRIFGERLQAIRIARGLTQEQLASSAGLSAHYIGNLEQGVRRPSLSALLLLCTSLGSTPNDLFEDFISDDMRAGLGKPISDDPYALRDSCTLLSTYFGDWFEEDDPSSPVSGTLADEIRKQEQLPLSKLLLQLQHTHKPE